jgi:HEAT repeat protein
LLVWILRQAKRVEASSALLEVYSHPKSSAPVRVEAACAVAALGDPDSIRTLVGRLAGHLGSADEADRKRIFHALSLAARQRIASLDDARV